MSPVVQFEESARTLWRSDLSAPEKAKRLNAVRAAILHYLSRMAATAGNDPWASRSLDRARNYLKHLAADVEELALECERDSSRKKAPTTTNAYAA